MNIKDIEKIIKMLDGTDINEISIEHEGVKLQLKRGRQQEVNVVRTIPGSEDQVIPQPVNVSAPGQVSATPSQETAEEYIEITSPMVGTFYRAPSPESDPYVKVGDMVDKDTVVCIIETMKVMNEIQSEKQGKIVKILVENGKPVEFGQPIFLLEKI